MEKAAMSQRKLTLAIPVVAALAALAAVEIAIAESANRPRTDAVMGTFTASPVRVKQRICEGQDGPYLEIRGKLAGTVVSGSSSEWGLRVHVRAGPDQPNHRPGHLYRALQHQRSADLQEEGARRVPCRRDGGKQHA